MSDAGTKMLKLVEALIKHCELVVQHDFQGFRFSARGPLGVLALVAILALAGYLFK
jgi:hypothetical protein